MFWGIYQYIFQWGLLGIQIWLIKHLKPQFADYFDIFLQECPWKNQFLILFFNFRHLIGYVDFLWHKNRTHTISPSWSNKKNWKLESIKTNFLCKIHKTPPYIPNNPSSMPKKISPSHFLIKIWSESLNMYAERISNFIRRKSN